MTSRGARGALPLTPTLSPQAGRGDKEAFVGDESSTLHLPPLPQGQGEGRGLRVGGHEPGFTLLEVMVALAVAAGSFMALADLSGSALRNHAYARQLSQATLLARGKLAELEDTYEDSGFRDFDQSEEGDFGDQGHPELKWRVELKKPEAELSPEQLLAFLTGAGDDDAQGVMEKLMGLGTSSSSSQGSQSTPASLGAAGAVMSNLIKTQLTTFGEQIKKSLRELRLTVSWVDGRQQRQFTVVTHLLVLNPRAPGGARGDSPDVPPGISAPRQSASPATQPSAPPKPPPFKGTNP